MAGAGTGAWFGLLIGLLLSVFAAGSNNIGVLMLSGIAYGAVFGAVFGFAGHAMTGGRRDFASRSRIVAARYDVAADAKVAEEAKNLLIKLAWRENRPGTACPSGGAWPASGAAGAAGYR